MLGMVSRVQIKADIKAELRGSSDSLFKAKAVRNQDELVSSGSETRGTGERERRAWEGLSRLQGKNCFHSFKKQETQVQHQCLVRAFLLGRCLSHGF